MRWRTYVFDLFDCKVCVCGDTDCLWSYVYDDHHRPSNVSFQKIINLLI